MNEELVLISEKGNMRRFRRQISRFDPNAIDADNDGVVQEGTPFKRPAAPRKRQMRGQVPQTGRPVQSRFWDYQKPRTFEPLEELIDEDVPRPQNWRDVPLKPRSGSVVSDTTKHTITSKKVKRDEWYAFQDAILERLLEVRDDESIPKDERRGLMKLYSSIKQNKPKINDDGELSIELTDTERARILKGIQSMKKKKFDIPNMDIIVEMLEAVEKKTILVPTLSQTGRDFVGTRYKSKSLLRVWISDSVGQHPQFDLSARESGLRRKGDSPRLRIDAKALGRSIGGTGRRSGRVITSRFDPNAVDADADGLVQDSTPFERPATPSTPSLIGNQKPISGGLPEGRKKPQRKNSVMKAQADRKAMNFQIEKLRSTLRRVGNDYAPSWWDTKDDKEFAQKIKQASPEELSELFARIYVERRALMTAKVGRMPDGSIKVFADTPDKNADARDLKLKQRGESVYREMFGRIVMRDAGDADADPKVRKKRSNQFMDWYQHAADNADWYFEQSFKITRRKSRKKLGVDAPVNKRGTRWAEDPNFPVDAFDKVIESIETDLRRANPSISDQSARRRAQEIVRDADKRISRSKPNKTPRAGGNREVVNPEYRGGATRRFARRLNGFNTQGRALEWKNAAALGYAQATPQIPRRKHENALKEMNAIISNNEQKFGQLNTVQDWKKAFNKVVPGAKIDLLNSNAKQLNDYEKKILHAYLHTFDNNSYVTNFPITIVANDSEQTLKGYGGSHSFIFNPKGTGRDTFEHVFRYAAYDDVTKSMENNTLRWGYESSAQGTVIPYGVNDTVSNQIVTDFLEKKLTPNMTDAELEALYDEATAFEAFMTSLHEGGHGSHLAAMMIDAYGMQPIGKDLVKQVNRTYDAMSQTDKKRAVRNTLHYVLNDAVKASGAEAGRPFKDLMMTGYDIEPLIQAIENGVPLTDQSIISTMNPIHKTIWSNVVREELQTPGTMAARIKIFRYADQWKRAPIATQTSMGFMESFIQQFANDPDIKNVNIQTYIDKFPLTPNGEIDIPKLMQPNATLFRVPNASGGLSPYKFRDTYSEFTVKFLAHKQFEYDSLSQSDQVIAEAALDKLSYYARTTRRYGPEYGKTHVEGLAELHNVGVLGAIGTTGFVRAGRDLGAPFTEVNFTADELRVMNTLLAWLRR